MIKTVPVFIFLQFIFSLGNLYAQDEQKTSQDSIVKNLKISAFPVAFYTPETAFGLGDWVLQHFI